MKVIHKLFIPIIFLIILISLDAILLGTTTGSSIPKPPQQLTITKFSAGEVDLTWKAIPSVKGYKIYRSTANNPKFTLIATTSKTSFKNLHLTPSTTYWYYVRAYTSYKLSKPSNRIKIITNKKIILPKKLVLGFATKYHAWDVSSYNSLITNASAIDQIATATFNINNLGELSGAVPSNIVAAANKNKIKPLAVITNNFDGGIAKAILESPVNRQKLIANTLATIKANSYKGVNVDIEGTYPVDKDYFSTFMKELYNKLHPLGFIVSVCLPAKTIDTLNNPWSSGYDYEQIGKYSDSVVVMAYDEHYIGGSAGPIASIDWVKAVVSYTTSMIPKNKVLLGVGAYGYDWSSTGTKAYGIYGINNLLLKYKAKVIFDPVTKCPHFSYKDSAGYLHNVWFENSASVGYKLDLVNSSKISGIAIWRLGLENPSFWTTIKAKFNK